MTKEEMDRDVCTMLGVEEDNVGLVSQITQCFLLSITHQLATRGEAALAEFGKFQREEEGAVSFYPCDFTSHFIRAYQGAR